MHWEVDVTKGDGFRLQNRGVLIMTNRHCQVVKMQDFVFDTGEKFLAAWGVLKPEE